MVQVINFSVITGDNTKTIAYTFNVMDDTSGAIKSANIKRSLPFTADTALSAAINTDKIENIADAIKQYLVANTTL